MSLDFTKVNYVDGSTIIEADNLNDIQDAILALDNNKVEAVSGKGLSTEDYTSAEKAKLSGIETGAQVNPGNATTSADGLMSSVDKAKLNGIAAGATAVTIDSTLTVAGQAADAKATGDALAEKYEKPSGGIPKTDLASGVQRSLKKADSALQQHQDISGKADKVQNATVDNFAALDANGNLKDSGHKHSDYLTQHQSLAAYRTAAAQDEIDAGKETAGLGLTSASVGDLVRVAAVDANGKPTSWEHVTSGDVTRMCAKADELGFVINGNTCTSNVTAGQYVILRNSTISGKTDGLYTAAKAIPANTALDATYLTAVMDGGLNALSNAMPDAETYALTPIPDSGFSLATWGFCNLLVYGKVAIIAGAGISANDTVTNKDAFNLPSGMSFRNYVLAPLAYGVPGIASAFENGTALKLSFSNPNENGIFNLVALLN